jgi:hypothetical protein
MKGPAARGSDRRLAKLYWCSTPDHDEDWFVIARTPQSARRYHENEEGYDKGTAEAEYVCDVPTGFVEDPPCWPSKAAIEACGGEFLKGGVRIVRINGRVYAEGDAFENAAVEQGALRRQ